ncbi:hypothetical protein [Streptomyces ehimensis]|uniref:Uncharacterized protein n=1 Tax=Streptomyces ehimensis TaxID=68195 RepID=A0ABV9BU47_9ACTN
MQATAWQGLAVQGLSTFRHSAADDAVPAPVPDGRDGLLVAYGTPAKHAFAGALENLIDVLPPAP